MSCEDGIDVLRAAARHRDALAVRFGDDLAVSVNAARLRRAVLALYRALGATAAAGGVEHLSDALAPWIAFAECVRPEGCASTQTNHDSDAATDCGCRLRPMLRR